MDRLDYVNIRVMEASGFDPSVYAEYLFDKQYKYMVVRHVENVGKRHFHFVGVIKPNQHNDYYLKYAHPDKAQGKRPINSKKDGNAVQMGDVHQFEYILKPTEYKHEKAHPGSMLIETNWAPDQVTQFAIQSELYFRAKKTTLQEEMALYVPEEKDSPAEVHYKMWQKAMQFLKTNEKSWVPHYKYAILTAMYDKGERYHSFVYTRLS